MFKDCIALKLKLSARSRIAFSELGCYRFVVEELNKFSRVLYARPYLFNSQSLSRNGSHLDIVIQRKGQFLMQFLHGLRGIKVNKNSLELPISRVSQDQSARSDEEKRYQALEELHDIWKQQLDSYKIQKRHELHGSLPSFIKVGPWLLDTEIPSLRSASRQQSEVGPHENEILVLKSGLYSDFESMPLQMQKWFIGMGRKSREEHESCLDRLDILTYGFKGF